MKKCIYVSLFIFLLLTLSLMAKEEENKTTDMTVDDVINMEQPGHLRISPDNSKILWEQKKSNTDKNSHISNIWLTSLTGISEPVQLTQGSGWASEWSPDGKKIAFLSDREDELVEIYIISPSGGEAEKLFKSEEAINSFKWKDKDTIVFTSRENKYHFEQNQEDNKDDAESVEDKDAFVPYRLFSYSIKDKKVKRLTDNKDQITDFIISPDGKWAITTHMDSPLYGNDPNYSLKYYLLNLETLKIKEIFKDPHFSPSEFSWDKNGSVYLIEEKSNFEEKKAPGIPILYEYSPVEDIYKEIPMNWEKGIGLLSGKPVDGKSGKIATTIASGAVNPLVILTKEGKNWKVTKIEDSKSSNIEAFQLSDDGKNIAYIYSTANEPPQIYYSKLDGNKFVDTVKLTDLNENFKDIFLAKREIIKWKSDGGREIEGIVFYPKDYKEGNKYPLILSIHGGPSWYDGDYFDTSWAYYPHILAAKNSFVLEVNYSGSANYGLPFLESIFGHYYELEIPDILSGVDYLIGKGMVDPDKLATMGWSNGSILSIALTAQTDRFKAACCGAGDVNWLSDYGNCAFGVTFDNLYLNGPCWENPSYYIEKSPLFKMKNVTTPTLIIFGGADTSVPTEQGYEHYRALQQLGKTVKFILMPEEPHSLAKISHQKRKMEEELAWFNKYLFQDEKKINRSFMEGSPIDIEIKKSDFACNEKGHIGLLYKDILIPETAESKGLNIGRFEVTRAQFEEFIKDNKDVVDIKNLPGWTGQSFKGGTENYPVSGITLDMAQKYCKWLKEKTGKEYRLPTADEMDKCLEECSGSENNLDYWAGYVLTPDERDEIKEYIEKLEKAKGLILPVGTFTESIEKIYDLNGNVSELCSDGSVKGLSAISISDKKEPYKSPSVSYIGFRVICQ